MSLEDRAQEHEAAEWEIRNRPREPKKLIEPGAPGYGPSECEDCGNPMPELRRANGWSLCTECQSLIERRARR